MNVAIPLFTPAINESKDHIGINICNDFSFRNMFTSLAFALIMRDD
jgi:hypothetical protein